MLEDLERIFFVGGEPLLQKEHYQVLDQLIALKNTETIKYIMLQEYIKLGQRVKSFTIEAWINNQWQAVANETTIGYKRILKLDGIKTNKLRVNILASKACPLISTIGVY